MTAKIQIKQITAHSSELGDIVNGMTFKTVAQADAVIFALIAADNAGHAKTKLDVEFEDGHIEQFDCDFCTYDGNREGLQDSIDGIHEKYAEGAEWDERTAWFQSKEQFEERRRMVQDFEAKYQW